MALPTLQEIVVGKAHATPAVVAVPALQAMIVALDIPAVMPAVVALPGVQAMVIPLAALGTQILLSCLFNNLQGFSYKLICSACVIVRLCR